MLEKKLDIKIVNENSLNSLFDRVKSVTVKYVRNATIAVGIGLAGASYVGCGQEQKEDECCNELYCSSSDFYCVPTDARSAQKCVTDTNSAGIEYQNCCRCNPPPK